MKTFFFTSFFSDAHCTAGLTDCFALLRSRSVFCQLRRRAPAPGYGFWCKVAFIIFFVPICISPKTWPCIDNLFRLNLLNIAKEKIKISLKEFCYVLGGDGSGATLKFRPRLHTKNRPSPAPQHCFCPVLMRALFLVMCAFKAYSVPYNGVI